MSAPRIVPGFVVAVAVAVVLAGCASETDDEMQPRPTETVTVTGEPEPTSVPERLPIGAGEPAAEAVWAKGSVLHRDEVRVDLGSLTPESIVVVPGGLLVLAGGELWFTDGREAVGQAFAPVTEMALSEDGTQVLVQAEDRDEPVGYAVADGSLLAPGDVAQPRTEERTEAGPGDLRVVSEDGSRARVLRSGEAVRVRGLPADFRASGWIDASRVVGVGSRGRILVVHDCDLGTRTPSCRVVRGQQGETGTEPYVFAQHPDG